METTASLRILKIFRFFKVFTFLLCIAAALYSLLLGSVEGALFQISLGLGMLAITHQTELVFKKRHAVTWREAFWDGCVVTPALAVTACVVVNMQLKKMGVEMSLAGVIDAAANMSSWYFVAMLIASCFIGGIGGYVWRKQNPRTAQ